MGIIHKINRTLVYLVLIVDVFNGLLLSKGIGFPISQLFKGLFTILLFLGLINFSYKKAFLWFCLTMYFLIFPNLFNLFNDSSKVIPELIHSQKFLFAVLVYFYFKETFKRKPITNLGIFLILNILIISVNIFLTYWGYGFFAYNNSVGATGYFFSSNELSFTALLIFGFYLFYENKTSSNYFRFYLVALTILILAILLGMKIAIFGILMISAFLIVKNKNILLVGLGIVIVLSYVTIQFQLLSLINPLIELWSYRLSNSSNFLNFILSNRDTFLTKHFHDFINSSLVQIIFGTGKSITVEMDFFDTLFNYGVVGIMIIYTYYAAIIRDIRHISNKNSKTFGLFLNIMIILGSAIAGHFVFSAMAGFFFGYLNSTLSTTKLANG